jgi:hypothetical protein
VKRSFLALTLAVPLICFSQEVRNSSFEGQPAVTLANNKLALTVSLKGSTLAELVLNDDPEKLNPFWNPIRMARELGRTAHFDGGAGLFVCVDGFGPTSQDEQAAGLPGHGEAHRQIFQVQSGRQGASTFATLTAPLPIVHETFTRTIRLEDGENVIHVESELQSDLGFDRPANWAEHATLGSPFLASGETVVDISGSKSQTRPWDQPEVKDVQRRLPPGKDFTWPMAPSTDGKQIDLRETPGDPQYLDHATTLLDPSRELEWATAINLKHHLLIGYLFRRSEYPWLQYWGWYPPNGKFARGMEFASQPYDVSRRETITMGSMFGAPAFRWLPAKSKITSHFLVFYTRVPDQLRKVDDVRLENGHIVIEDHGSNQRVSLVSRGAL